MQVTTASQHSAMGVRSRDARSEAGISYRSRCDEVRKSQRMEWVPRAIQTWEDWRGGCAHMVRQSRSGRLQWVAGVSGRVKINRYAMAVRASPSRLQSTLSAPSISMSRFGVRARNGSAQSRDLLCRILALNRLGFAKDARQRKPHPALEIFSP